VEPVKKHITSAPQAEHTIAALGVREIYTENQAEARWTLAYLLRASGATGSASRALIPVSARDRELTLPLTCGVLAMFLTAGT
jgi:hypothetical protein